jgi:hypothetical protein
LDFGALGVAAALTLGTGLERRTFSFRGFVASFPALALARLPKIVKKAIAIPAPRINCACNPAKIGLKRLKNVESPENHAKKK